MLETADTDRGTSPELPLTPVVFEILLALADGDRHGYGIMLEVEQRTDGMIKLGPGTLYGSIKRMLGSGLIAEVTGRPSENERRRYYRLTSHGRQTAAAEADRLARQVRQARKVHLLPADAE